MDSADNMYSPALGISKHGTFEVDQSISRIDTNFGNQANFNLDRWNNIVDITHRHGDMFGIETWAEERAQTYQQSRDTNPNFNAEVSLQLGAHVILDQKVLKILT